MTSIVISLVEIHAHLCRAEFRAARLKLYAQATTINMLIAAESTILARLRRKGV